MFCKNMCLYYLKKKDNNMKLIMQNLHSFIKSEFFGLQQFSFNPAGIFSLKDTLKIYKGKKKIRKPSSLSLNPVFKKECHLLSDKLESMEIYALGFINESLGGLNFH